MKPTIHGKKTEYKQGQDYAPERAAYIDSEGNIFPTVFDCAQFHKVAESTIYKSMHKRPFKSQLFKKPVAVHWLVYPKSLKENDYTYYRFLFTYSAAQLEKYCEVYDEYFNNYIFKKIPAHITLIKDPHALLYEFYDKPTIVEGAE